jgi:hypothetical protein
MPRNTAHPRDTEPEVNLKTLFKLNKRLFVDFRKFLIFP